MNDTFYLVFIYVAFFIAAITFSFLLNKILLKFSKTLGIRNENGAIIRWSSEAKPALGGLGFYILFLISITTYSIFFSRQEIFLNKEFIGIFAAISLGFLMGLADDAYNTKPILKLLTQICCGVILVVTGTYIQFFSNDYLNYMLTLIWVVGIMNSINMLDNMDSITATVSISIILAAFSLLIFQQDFTNIHLMMFLGVLAALLGFLYYNWHPSKMFMGDTGSQFLGIFLAAIGIIYFWNDACGSGIMIPDKQLIMILLAFTIPIIDTTTVVINRLLKGSSPFIGGKDHTTHHLAYLGLSDRKVALLYSSLSLLSLFLILLITRYIENWSYIYTIIFGGYFLILFASLYSTTRIKKRENLHNSNTNNSLS